MAAPSRDEGEVAELLERVTGLRFAPSGPVDDGLTVQSLWCIACGRATDEAPFLWRCWEDREGGLWVETPQFADAVESMLSYYPEVLLDEVKEFDYAGFDMEEVQKRYREQLGAPPGSVALYRNYALHVTAENGVDADLKFDGGVGILLLSIGIKLAKRGEPLSEDRLRKAMSVMKYLQRQIEYEEDEDKP